MVQSAKHIVILTGAGISAESGIKTFRACDGLWEEHRVEDVATPEGYARDPELVQRFTTMPAPSVAARRDPPQSGPLCIGPSGAPAAGRVTLVTQNIDNLHESAGSKNLIHMHGELLKARCPGSGQVIEWRGDLHQEELCSCCQFPHPLRPHVVWFGRCPRA
jgi:NAD-dependent deacetylase